MRIFDPALPLKAPSREQLNNTKPTEIAPVSAPNFAEVFQQLNSSTSVHQITEVSSTEDTSSRNVVEEFMAWVQMTPAEKLRDRILKELGLTEEQLEAMDPEEQEKIEELIAQRIRDQLEQQHGLPRTDDNPVLKSRLITGNI